MKHGLIFSVYPGILTTWSNEDIDEGAQNLLVQSHSILLSTLISINRKQLSLFDARFALLLSSPPLTVYLVVAVYCSLCGMETELCKRIRARPLVIFLGAWAPFLWLLLSMLLRLSSQAFTDSTLCANSMPETWVRDLAEALLATLRIGSCFAFFVPLFLTCLILIVWRRWSQLVARVRPSLEGSLRPWEWLRIPWTFAKHVWYVLIGSCRCGPRAAELYPIKGRY